MYLAADKLRTPAVRAVAEIANHLGGPVRVARIRAVPFPGAVWQLSEYVPVPASPDRPPAVVALYLKGGKPEHWTPVEGGFDAAVARFQGMAAQAREIEAAASASREPAAPAPGPTRRRGAGHG